MSSQRIRVAIVDDHPIVREGLRAYLQLAEDIDIVAEGDSGPAAVALATQVEIDVMVTDLVMPGAYDGIEGIRRVHALKPDLKIIALTSFQQEQRALDALAAGAIGYLHKDVQPDLLLGSIRQAAAGRMVIEAEVWAYAQSSRKQNEDLHAHTASPSDTMEPDKDNAVLLEEGLTNREVEVLLAMAEGQSNKEIGSALGISEKTVKVHVSHILAKLDVYDRTQAVLLAAKRGLVKLE